MDSDRLARLGMLASALGGRTLQVTAAEPGDPPWTDGVTMFLDADGTARQQLEALAVQASLLAAGSLEPAILRKLKRRPALAARYLSVEGHRALAANENLLPASLRTLVQGEVRSDSPAASLALARGRQPIDGPPASFGTIRPRKLLAARDVRPKELPELDEDDTGENDAAADMFTSPVGGGGALGKLLRRMLRPVRELGEAGQPGANAPTHRSRSGSQGAPTTVLSSAPVGLIGAPGDAGAGITYPEWDIHRQAYRPDWCTVRAEQPCVKAAANPDPLDGYALRRPLARLGLGPDWFHRQIQGDDLDIDAAIEARVQTAAGSAPDEAVYVESLRRRRDLAVLVLLDVSGSVGEAGAAGKTVHEQQRSAAAALAVALYEIGDRLALYAFHSQGRQSVQVMPLKRFDDALDVRALRRLAGLVPGAYSRLGAAIRHGAAVLESRGGTTRRLLVVISDGLAYDHGYERDYGAADARRALAEARGRGTGCVCLTIGATTDPEELQRVFGSAAHATIARSEELSQVVGPLFRTALRAAEVRRSETQRNLRQISVPR